MTTATVLLRTKTFLIKERFAEALNLILYIAWAIALLADGGMLNLHAYRGFTAPAWVYGVLFLILSGSTIVGMFPGRHCRKVASESMMLGFVAWLLVAVEYWYSYPPFQPAMFALPGLAVLDLLVSMELEHECKCRGDDV